MRGTPPPPAVPHRPDTGAEPTGPIIGGLRARLRNHACDATVSAIGAPGTDALTFVGTVERAATGLSRRGVCPGDVVATLAPVSPTRLTAVHTVMAVGGIVLPLDPASDLKTQVDVLTETDARLMLVTTPLAGTALELAERSRIRQIIAFGEAPETTPFGELLLPTAATGGNGRAGGPPTHGVLSYQATCDGPVVSLYDYADLLERFRTFDTGLDLGQGDVVAVDPRMSEPARVALAALALRRGASVVTTASETEPEIRHDLTVARATVRGSPVPRRLAPRD